MKATGIVRRIDELGRIVIPKEIRRTLRIREGDSLEIFTNRENELILKKYSPINEMSEYSDAIVSAIHEATGMSVLISDSDAYISVSSDLKREYSDFTVSPEVDNIILSRKEQALTDGDIVPLKKDNGANGFTAQLFVPIMADGENYGVIAAVTENTDGFTASDTILLKSAALYLAKQLG